MRYYLDSAPIIFLDEQAQPYATAVRRKLSAQGLTLITSELTRMEWTGRAPAPNGSESASGLVRTRSTTMPCSTIRAVATIGIDIGKNTLHMIGLDSRGAIVLREKVSRGRISSRLANLPPCLIGIEAGMATHYVARELAAVGHDVKQVPPTYAKPFRQWHKNDFRDAMP